MICRFANVTQVALIYGFGEVSFFFFSLFLIELSFFFLVSFFLMQLEK